MTREEISANQDQILVEYPLRLNDAVNCSKAINSMGGMTRIYEGKALEIRFRANPFAHPLNGTKLERQGVVCRITRRAGNASDTPKETARIVARIKSVIRFRELADYQFQISPDDPMFKLRQNIDTLNVEGLKEFVPGHHLRSTVQFTADCGLIPPPVFSKLLIPIDYQLRQHGASESLKTKRQLLKKHGHIPSGVTFHEPAPDHPVNLSDVHQELMSSEHVSILKELFAERPIWTRSAINERLAPRKFDLKLLLPLVAFHFTGGPWRTCWIRYGYDPRNDVSASKYQLLDFRAQQRSHAPSSTITGVSPSLSVMQICDMDDEVVRQMIDQIPLSKRCDARYGWFEELHLEAIRKTAKMRVSGEEDPDLMKDIVEQLKAFSASAETNESESSAKTPGLAPRITQKTIDNRIDALMQGLNADVNIVDSLEQLASESEVDEELEYDLFGV